MLFGKDFLKLQAMMPNAICSIGEGGNGDGAGDGAGGGGGEQPAFDPAAFEQQMKDFVVRAVNGSVSTHLSRTLSKQFEENNQNMMNQFSQLLEGHRPAPQEPTGGGDPDLQTQIQNATAPIMKQLEAEKQAREQVEARAAAERQQRQRQEENSALQSALTNAGVPGPLAAAAVNLLHGSLERDDNGAIQFISKQQSPAGPYEERVDIATGVTRFLATEDGKHFLPARPASGSGNRGGRAPGANPGEVTDREAVGAALTGLFG